MSAAVFVPGMTVGVPKLSLSGVVHRSLEPTKKKNLPLSTIKFVTIFRTPSGGSGTKRSFRVTASDQRSEQAGDGEGVQEDLKYLWKIGFGSVAAASVIKYGSVLFPEITRPNLTQALFIILSPVVISVILLIRASSSKKNQT